MDLFGLKEHDERHDEVERQLRRLVEQVAQLSIDLGVTRMELRRVEVNLAGKANTDDVDPALLDLNDAIGEARRRLAATSASADESWNQLSEELSEALRNVRSSSAVDDGDASA